MNWTQHIATDPGICGGQPVFCGTRVLLRTVLGYLAHGEPAEKILADYPTLSAEQVRAAIAFAASAAGEDLPLPGHGPF